jgi:AraC family transcriptional regulator of adaptative response/methylated-DNA-[protein]-cysteine methyltransferase
MLRIEAIRGTLLNRTEIPMNVMPSRRVMVRALLARDPEFEGLFYAGVTTTGVFCRPTCSARKPRPENVQFYATPTEALHAGFRPCRVCRPLERQRRAPRVVTRLLAAIERHPEGRVSDKELTALGIDASTARRRFRAHFGMTFQAYQRARRMGLALRDLGNGRAVSQVHRGRGFATPGGMRKAFVRVFGRPPKGVATGDVLLAERIETPLGAMLALASEQGLCLLEFVDRRGLEREILTLRRRTRTVVVPGTNPHLAAARRQLAEYFRGERRTFDVPVALHGSPFQRSVWSALLDIPAGETASYADIARAVGRPKAVRAVGTANGSNVLAVVIPCHRVVRHDGTLGGYGGGTWRKQWLIEHERSMSGAAGNGTGREASEGRRLVVAR